MSNKTISINPSLFSMNTKTRKRKELPSKETTIISPTLLKTKLLKRIKEHKHKEQESLKETLKESTNTPLVADEFNNSINYFQALSKERKTNELKQKQQEALQRKTLKNHSDITFVNTELPDELKEQDFSISLEEPLILSKKDDKPYGILKGGVKPTYSEWTKTQRHQNFSTNTNTSNTTNTLNTSNTSNPNINTISFNIPSERDTRLNNLREKIKLKKMQLQAINQQTIDEPKLNLILPENISFTPKDIPPNLNDISTVIADISNKTPTETTNLMDLNDTIKKKLIKKTIHKKYTLGKSQIKRQIGVLLKDHTTRKNVINAQRELKSEPIHDIKNYLREHNLIKIGTNAPNEVIRKIYESAMLAGDINNNNIDTLLHNLSKDGNK
jgi:hypothetical protein